LLQNPRAEAKIIVTVGSTTAGYLLANALMASTIPPGSPDHTDDLLDDAAGGDAKAIERLLERYRDRLRRMIALRLDDRLLARLDPSDVVQEALTDAAKKLTQYARDRPLPFYPWLHRLAAERLAAVYRRHRKSQARSVTREEAESFTWSESSGQLMVSSLVAHDTPPGDAVLREEQRLAVHAALRELSPADREILMMHYLEELSFPEIAAILDIGEGAAKMRHLRALQRIRAVMASDDSAIG
jgi:RNA polymerase sigma-70 factor (ECF subfamily)